MKSPVWTKSCEGRRYFLGGSDARIIMGSDEGALLRLWQEKRGEAGPEDLSGLQEGDAPSHPRRLDPEDLHAILPKYTRARPAVKS